MAQYIVKVLSLGSRRNKIFKSGEICTERDFKHGEIEKLLEKGFIEPLDDNMENTIGIVNSSGKSMMIFVFSYNRKQMLESILETLDGELVVVIDDGSDYVINHANVMRFANGGKREFWKRWNTALEIARQSNCQSFMFMPDDFLYMDMQRIKLLCEQMNDAPYVYNIINDDREWSWIKYEPKQIDDETIQIGFTDCGFFCNRTVLELLDFRLRPITRGNLVSSGVGHQLTTRLTRLGVPFFKPVKSLAYHGDHPSMMHPKERKRNPIISK